MKNDDAYESLLDMYEGKPFNTSKVAGTFIEVLRFQFTPEEAELAVGVGLKGRKLDQIQERTGIEKNKLKKMLNTMADKGTMWIKPGIEDPTYQTIGVAGPGLLETGGWGNVRFPHSIQLLKALYTFQLDFAKNILGEMPFSVAQVWTTPAALPDDAEPNENVAKKIKEAGYWGVSTCSCRLPHWVADPGNHCEHLLETCLFMSDMARWGVEHGICREITYDEVLEILRKCNKDGLVHTYDPNDFICNCCPDCCVLQIGAREPGAKVLEPSAFIAQVDDSTCNSCNTCADRCPFGAIEVNAHALVDINKCLGCGVCFPTCSTDSIHFVRRPKAEEPSLETVA
jgi:electron transport complex protein RnfB